MIDNATASPLHSLYPVGARVFLQKPHPWHGNRGTVVAHENWMGSPALRVRLDEAPMVPYGQEAGVTDTAQVSRIKLRGR